MRLAATDKSIMAPAAVRVRAVPGTPWLGLVFALVGTLAALALAFDMVFRLHLSLDDGVSRVANAAYVIFSRDPHLAAIGFIWPPLPSLVDLVILAFTPLFPPLLSAGFAANVGSALAFGGTILTMDRTLRRFHVLGVWRFVWLSAFVANPLLLFYGLNGMSESLLLFCLALAVDALVNYLQTGHYSPLGLTGLWLAATFLVGYEAVAIGAGVAVGIALQHVAKRRSREQLDASVIYAMLPLVYIGILWMVANWIIMGNPLFFAESKYGNATQIASGGYYGGQTYLVAGIHSVTGSLFFVGAHFLLAPIWIALALWAWLSRRMLIARVLTFIPLSVFLMQFVMTWAGDTAGWARFFFYVVPGAFWLAGALANQHRRRWIYGLLGILLLFSSVGTAYVETQTWVGHGDRGFMLSIWDQKKVYSNAEYAQIAAYLNTLPLPNGPILSDTFNSFDIVLHSKPMSRMAVTSDLNFESLLAAPWGRVSYMLVPAPRGTSTQNKIDRKYPSLYAHGASWATLVKRWPGWRLYRVSPRVPA